VGRGLCRLIGEVPSPLVKLDRRIGAFTVTSRCFGNGTIDGRHCLRLRNIVGSESGMILMALADVME